MLALSARRLKISRLDRQNDPFELFADTQEDRVRRGEVRAERAAIAAQWGMVCFCRDWHEPVLWGHYAERHQGLCLGFEVAQARAVPVTYISKRVGPRCLEDAIASSQSADGPPSLAAMKFANWRYENEVRLWARLDEKGADLQFIPFSADMKLRSVHLGPRCDVTRAEITKALGKLASDVEIVATRLAFRTFRVVKQRDRSRWR
jgi:hypothetical protein